MTECEETYGGMDARLLDEGYGPGGGGMETDVSYACRQLWYFREEGWRLWNGQEEYGPEPGELYLIPAGAACCLERIPGKEGKKCGRKEAEGKEGIWRCCFRLSFPGERGLGCFREVLHCRPERSRAEGLVTRIHEAEKGTAGGWLLRQAAFLELLALFLEYADCPECLTFPENAYYENASVGNTFPGNTFPGNTFPRNGGRTWMQKERMDEFDRRVAGYVDSHLSERITVKELADAVHLQPGYFIQRFKKSFHTTPICYVNRMRLEHTARRMEGDPEERLEEIARVAGFGDYRYFSRLFKREYGMPPSVYRANRLGEKASYHQN